MCTAPRSPTTRLITYDAAERRHWRGHYRPHRAGDRATLRRFLERWAGEQVETAVEATTGWRFVVEELQRASGVDPL